MSVIRAENIIRDINVGIDGESLARLLDYHPEKIQTGASTIKCFCPLHKEQAFRSLLLDDKTKTYRCKMKRCVGFDGGSLVELWGLVKGLEDLDAALDLAERLNLDIDVASMRSLGAEMVLKTESMLQAGDLAEARMAIDQAISFMPHDATSARLSARIHEAGGDVIRAVEEKLRAFDLLVEAGEFKTANEILAPMLEAAPDNLQYALCRIVLAQAGGEDAAICEAMLRVVEIHGRQGSASAQIEALGELVEAAGEQPESLNRAAQIYEEAGQTEELIGVLQQLSRIHELEAQWKELFEIQRRRIKLEPDNLILREELAGTLLRLNRADEAAKTFIELADDHKSSGGTEKAQDLLNQLLKLQPGCAEAKKRLAAWNAESGNPAEAIELYRSLAAQARETGRIDESAWFLSQAKIVDPEDTGVRRDLAETNLAQGDLDGGLKELFELADIHLTEADPSEGFVILKRIDELAPADQKRQIEIGQCLEAGGFDDRALESYRAFIERMRSEQKHESALEVCIEAARLAHDDAELLETRIGLLLDLSRKDEAIEVCREIARSHIGTEEFDKAEGLLQRAIKIDRTESSAKSDLAHLYETMERTDEAGQVWIEVALFHRAAEDMERALQAAREALRLSPANTEAMGIAAEALEQQGQISAALELWKASGEQMLELEPASAEALSILTHALGLVPQDLELRARCAKLKLQIDGPEAARPLFDAWLEGANAATSGQASLDAIEATVEAFADDHVLRQRLCDRLIALDRHNDALVHIDIILDAYRGREECRDLYRQALELVVRLSPDRLETRVELATAAGESGEIERASTIFAEVARQYLARGDQEQGLEVLQLSLRYQSENADLVGRVAELLELVGRHDEAIETYERLLKLNRDSGESTRNIPVLRKLLVVRPDRADLHLALAENLESVGERDAAVEHFYRVAQARLIDQADDEDTLVLCLKITALMPGFTAGREALVECRLARGEVDEAKRELDALAEVAFGEGNLDHAESIYLKIQKLDPKDIGSGERLGRLYEAKGETDRAAKAYRGVLGLYRKEDDAERIVSVLRKLKGLNPEDLKIRRELARTLAKTERAQDEAAEEWIELVSAAVDQNRAKVACKAMIEAVALLEGQWDRRYRLTQLIVRILKDAESCAAWKDLATEALAAERSQIASDAADEGLALEPDDLTLRELKIEALCRLEDWDGAIDSLRLLAALNTEREDHPAAESHILRALELNPDDSELLDLLAQSQIAQNHLDDAVETLRHLAERHREQGELDLAIGRAEQVVGLQPGDADAKDYLAKILIETGDIDRAMEIWREIAETQASAGKSEIAIARFKGILVHRDRDIPALRRLADLTLESQGAEAAHACFESLLGVVAEDAPIDEVEAEFRRAIELQTGNLALAEKFALWLDSAGRGEDAATELARIATAWRDEHANFDEALRIFELLREVAPDDLSVLNSKAALYEKMDRAQDAVSVLVVLAREYEIRGEHESMAHTVSRRADILNSEVEAQVEAAEAFELIEDADTAVKFLLRAIAIYDANGDLSPCVALLKRTIALKPDQQDLGVALAQVYEQTDQTDEAVAQWLKQGDHHEINCETERATEIYGHIKTVDPNAMEPRRRLARLAEEAGNSESARTELAEMIPIASAIGDSEETIGLLRRILDLDPRDTATLGALADQFRRSNRDAELFETLGELELVHRESGEHDQALAMLEEMRVLRPGDPELAVRNFDMLIATGKEARAVRAGSELIGQSLTEGNLEQAEALISRLISIDPENIDRRIDLAQLALNSGHEELARKQFHRGHEDLSSRESYEAVLALAHAGVELFPADVTIRENMIAGHLKLGNSERAIEDQIALAELHQSRDETRKALEVFDAILELFPDHEETHESIVRLALSTGDSERSEEHLLRLAEVHYVEENLEGSIHALERLLELRPERSELRGRLAEMYHETGQCERARNVWLHAAAELKKNSEIQVATELYERLAELYPDDLEVLSYLAEGYRETGEDEKYGAHASRLGEAFLSNEAFGDAIVVYEQLSETFPKDFEVWERLSDAYAKAEESSGALRSLRVLYDLHMAERRFDRARTCLERSLAMREGDLELLQLLGDLCLRLNQRAEGLAYLIQAAQRLGQDQRHEEAREIIARVLTIDPSDLEYRRLLGQMCVAMGDKDEAVKQLTLAARGQADKRKHGTAIEIFEELLMLDETLTEEREAYARSLEKENRRSDACVQYLLLINSLRDEADPRQIIRYCRQILKENEVHFDARAELFAVYERTRKPRLALVECHWLVDSCVGDGDTLRAEEFIRRGLELASDDVELRKRLVDLLIDAERTDEAAENLKELATLAQRRMDQSTAKWALERACEIVPDNLDYRERLADLQEKGGDAPLARRTRLDIIRMHLESGAIEEAHRLSEQVTKSAPEDEDLRKRVAQMFEAAGMPEVAAFHYLHLAKTALNTGNFARVRKLGEQILQIKPNHIAARELLLKALEGLGKIDEACSYGDELYRLHTKAGNLDDALRALKFVIEHKPSAIEPRKQLVQIYLKMGRLEAMVDQLRRLAEICVNAGDIQGALESLRGLIDERPEDTRARVRYIDLFSQIGDESELYADYIKLAAILRQKGEVVEALRVYEKIIQQHPKRPECRHEFIEFLLEQGQISRGVEESRILADLYLADDRTNEASRVLDLALSKAPEDVDLRQQLARIQIGTNRRGLALETLRGLLHQFDASGDEPRQIETLVQMLELDPLNVDHCQSLAELYTRQGQAAKSCEQREALAEQYLSRDLYDLAEREYRRILDLTPGNAHIWERVIDTHLKIGSLSEVLPDILALANVYIEGGHIKEGISALKRVLEIEPDNIEVLAKYIELYQQIGLEQDLIGEYLHIAMLRAQAGETETAIQIYEHLRQIAPDLEEIERRINETDIGSGRDSAAPKSPEPRTSVESRLQDFVASDDPREQGTSDQIEKSLRNYGNILKLNPGNPSVRSKLAELLQRAGRAEDADVQWARAAEDFLGRGDAARSVNIYEKLCERSPENATYREGLNKAVLKRDSLKALESVIDTSGSESGEGSGSADSEF